MTLHDDNALLVSPSRRLQLQVGPFARACCESFADPC